MWHELAALTARRLAEQPLEAAGEDLAHHGEIVTGRELGRADVELAILAFLKSLDTGHDHGADRVGALNVAIVVDLDAARHPRQAKCLGKLLQQFLLRNCLGSLRPSAS